MTDTKRLWLAVIVAGFLALFGAPFVGWAADEPGPAPSGQSASEAMPVSGSTPMKETGLFGDRIKVAAGYRIWVAQWQTWNTLTAGTAGANQQISSFSPLMGPQGAISLKTNEGAWFNRVFVTAQYLNAGFDFHDAGTGSAGGAVHAINRNDLTFTLGTNIWRGLGAYVGYYRMLQHWGVNSYQIKGPMVGLHGTQPIADSRIALYGNVAMGWMTFHQYQNQQGFSTNDVQAYSGETGVNIVGPKIWKIDTNVQVGWRYQVLTQIFGQQSRLGATASSTTRAQDVTNGPTFTISASF
jgi:hypothetical protein